MDVRSTTLAAMRKTNDLFSNTAVRLRDMSVLDHVYTPEARILPPGAEMIQGLAEIKSFWLQAVSALDIKDAGLTTVSAEMAGDTVIEIGRAALTLGDGQVVAAKYVVHWKHHADAWKWDIDIWNLNQ
jgi:ketosteroid isomerase-like protein